MAYIKIFPIKVTDKKALDYIMNPDKTEEKLLISSFACSPESANLEFAFTREEGKKNVMDKGNNLAFHLIQSFKPGEVDAETAHKLGKEFADEVLKGKYEYVISTHVDQDHIHNHIIFNATSFVDHHKYVSNKRNYHKICWISNRICQENGLVTSMPTGEKGKSYKENMEYHRGNSWKAKLKVAVDKAIWSSINYDEFLQKMKLAGYEIRQGKNLAFRAPEQKNFTNMKSLGSYYTEENVLLRLEKNRHKTKKREIWTAETLMYALEVCEDDRLKLAMNLSFSCSLRISELLGLTWDCVDISEEAIEENRAYLFINKESQRVSKSALKELDAKDVLLIFPEKSKTNKTVRVLKTPKTDSSVRKVFLPKSVAKMLIEWKEKQDETKEVLGDEYMDYNLVMASTFGLPLGDGAIRKPLNQLIKDYDLPPVVFHSLRHSSVTYKLKLNGGDIKAVQGDSGHAQVSMVTDVYSHILDDDRKKNAELFEEAFYEKKNLDPQMHPNTAQNTVAVPEGIDAELLAKVLSNPEMAALLSSLAKTMK